MRFPSDEAASPQALARIRALSRPIAVLLSIALGLIFLVQGGEILAVLFAFHPGDRWQANVGFHEIGFDLTGYPAAHPQAPPPGSVSLQTLGLAQRAAVAALAVACAGGYAVALYNLRQLFALYSRGVIFSAANVSRMKWFALWLVIAAVAINVSGRLFELMARPAVHPTANVVMAMFYGGMIYVIARVMELACQADQERGEFV